MSDSRTTIESSKSSSSNNQHKRGIIFTIVVVALIAGMLTETLGLAFGLAAAAGLSLIVRYVFTQMSQLRSALEVKRQSDGEIFEV